MANTPNRHTVSLTVDRDVYDQLVRDARAQRRTLSNMMSVILADHYERASKRLNGHGSPHKRTQSATA